MNRLAARAAALALLAALGACAHQAPLAGPGPVHSPGGPGAAQQFGTVQAITPISSQEQLTGKGALAGGVAGAVVGRQFGGSSDGRALGTLLGAVAGVLIGNEVEKQHSGLRGGVRIEVALDGGGQRSFDFAEAGGLRVGDRVRVDGQSLQRL